MMSTIGVLAYFRIISILILISIASIIDFKTRTIPNRLNLMFTLLGFFLYGLDALSSHNAWIMLEAVIGYVIGFSLLLVPCLLDVMGAGDVKLMGALGVLCGPIMIIYIAVATSLFGGIVIIVRQLVLHRMGDTIKRTYMLLLSYVFGSIYMLSKNPVFYQKYKDNQLIIVDEQLECVPYGAMIAGGTVLSFICNFYWQLPFFMVWLSKSFL